MLSKCKENTDIEFAPVYSNSITNTVIGPEDNIDQSFQEVFYRIDNWISEGSGWIIESIDTEYVNTSIWSPLSVHTLNCQINYEIRRKAWLTLKTMTINTFFGVILYI